EGARPSLSIGRRRRHVAPRPGARPGPRARRPDPAQRGPSRAPCPPAGARLPLLAQRPPPAGGDDGKAEAPASRGFDPDQLQGLSFIIFVCYVASSASAFLTAPLLEFLLALCFLFADAMQLNDKWQGLCWPMMDFLRCVTAALIYFAISITAVAKYPDGASKAAGVFGFFATIVFAIDFYLIFNDVAKFLKQEDSAQETTADKAEEEDSDSDSD
uniref:CKLF like MARVEL transmembrane domain containing 3 n=1 Tax=Bos taurus TaxID=9913 RepID=G3MWS4_BOVIN